MSVKIRVFAVAMVAVVVSVVLVLVVRNVAVPSSLKVPREGKWGIYALDLSTERVELVYSTSDEIFGSLRLNSAGDRFVFAQKVDGNNDVDLEVFAMDVDGRNLRRLTNNGFWDLYPIWSPNGSQIAFLSKREVDLDIYVMDADGSDQRRLYDSGSNDADIDWVSNKIVFTSLFRVWSIVDDGTELTKITDLANAGEWGQANLPIGDYDPRFNPDGTKIAFERLEDPNTQYGGYNIFTVDIDGTGETRLTNTGYSQGLASWSHSGDEIVYIVAAVGNEGRYDMYMMNADGTDNRNITPDYFPADFLVHSAVFSIDDVKIYFIGHWV